MNVKKYIKYSLIALLYVIPAPDKVAMVKYIIPYILSVFASVMIIYMMLA